MRNPLHSICPYFAMFPERFVREKVERFSGRGEWVLDPFSGRGTTVLESRLAGHRAAASDINPVAYCLSRAKAEIPTLDMVTARIDTLESDFQRNGHAGEAARASDALPAFFRRSFYHTTLRELMFLRQTLAWQTDSVDCFVAALVLGSLHGEMDRSPSYFGNQMPRTNSLKPEYSLRYWRERGLFPKKRNVFGILRGRAIMRLADLPTLENGLGRLSDARQGAQVFPEIAGQVALLVSSPPYLDVTNFEEDQWLRLWFLGGDPWPTRGKVSKDDRHSTPAGYWRFLSEAWQGIRPLLKRDSVIVVRVGAKWLSMGKLRTGILESLDSAFSIVREVEKGHVSAIKSRQARSFNPAAVGCHREIDFAFSVRG
jgi:DNA methylase